MKKHTLILMFTFFFVPFTIQSMEWQGIKKNPANEDVTFTLPSAQQLANKFDQPDDKAFLMAVENSTEKTIKKKYLKNSEFINNASIGLLTAAHVIAHKQNKQKLQSELRSIINRRFPYANRQ